MEHETVDASVPGRPGDARLGECHGIVRKLQAPVDRPGSPVHFGAKGDLHFALGALEPRSLAIRGFEGSRPSRQVARIAHELEHGIPVSSNLYALNFEQSHGYLPPARTNSIRV